MNLKQLRSRSLDDIFYSGLRGYLDQKPSLPVELVRTDEDFLRNTFGLFCEIEEDKVTIIRTRKLSGMTTAMCFLIAYYALHHKNITVLGQPGAHNMLQSVCDMFAEFVGFEYSFDKKSNEAYLRHDGVVYCTINFLSDTAFNILNLRGLIIFNDCKKMDNLEKFQDIMKNLAKYDKVIMNFPQNEEIDKLAEEYKLKIKEIQILNG